MYMSPESTAGFMEASSRARESHAAPLAVAGSMANTPILALLAAATPGGGRRRRSVRPSAGVGCGCGW